MIVEYNIEYFILNGGLRKPDFGKIKLTQKIITMYCMYRYMQFLPNL